MSAKDFIFNEVPIEPGECYLYALADSRDKKPRYIGVTATPTNRYLLHKRESKDISFVRWWLAAEADGGRIEMHLITVIPFDLRLDVEKIAILYAHINGHQLFNRTVLNQKTTQYATVRNYSNYHEDLSMIKPLEYDYNNLLAEREMRSKRNALTRAKYALYKHIEDHKQAIKPHHFRLCK